jgi:hypothetical protein
LNNIEGKVFFYFALSYRWETSERNVIRDARVAREQGAKVIVYCYRDSVVDSWCKNHHIITMHPQGKITNRIKLLKTIKNLVSTFKKENVALIHCYDVDHLWPLAFFLRTDRVISLVFSLSHELKNFYRNIWFRPLVARIDHIFFISWEMVDNISGHLGVPMRKMDYIGTGGNSVEKSDKKPFTKERNAFYIGTNVSGTERDIKFIDVILSGFKILVESNLLDKKLYLVLASEKRWSHFIVANELRRKLTDMGLESNFIFVDSFEIFEVQLKVDLWVGQDRTEDIEDYCIEALLNRRPVLFPRTASSAEVIRQFGKIGETYKADDSREWRHKVIKVLENLDDYQKGFTKNLSKIKEFFGPDIYRERLGKSYQSLVGRRERFLRKNT